MSVLNDRDLMTYAMREALAREKHFALKIKEYRQNTRDQSLRKLCSEIIINCETRINIIKSEMKKLYIEQE